jgi:hypothetical protein
MKQVYQQLSTYRNIKTPGNETLSKKTEGAIEKVSQLIKVVSYWCGVPALFWLSSYVASHHLGVVPQASAKFQLYCTVYNIPLNLNCKAQRVSTKLKKIVDESIKIKINARGIQCILFTFLKEKSMFKNQ